ncbi:uracil-DNA glycosylase family protein [Novipirellula artificiosorum]|nr:uracil-DNA glycosylase family protein [Novipirellula artificiosorum]
MVSKQRDVRRPLIQAAKALRDAAETLTFAEPVTHVYNPLSYAWKSHQAYLRCVNPAGVRVVFLGMNPGPWGMAQTGVPFGEIAAVRDWIGIERPVERPRVEHPKRPVQGFACEKSEVSGRRLWGLFQTKYPNASDFFQDHFVANYCPLVFMEASAKNRTPDKLPANERQTLNEICDIHLIRLITSLNPEFVVGVGAYAESCLKRVLDETEARAKLSRILHPSPASPAANKGWADKATEQLQAGGVW